MLKVMVQEAAALASLSLFVGMVAIWVASFFQQSISDLSQLGVFAYVADLRAWR